MTDEALGELLQLERRLSTVVGNAIPEWPEYRALPSDDVPDAPESHRYVAVHTWFNFCRLQLVAPWKEDPDERHRGIVEAVRREAPRTLRESQDPTELEALVTPR